MNTAVKQQIATLLTASDPNARRSAAEDLTEEKDSAANAALVLALEDESKGVQDAAMHALIEIGDKDVARSVAGLIVNDNIATRNLAAKVLITIGTQAIQFLIPYLRDTSKDTRKFAVDILGRIGTEESLSQLLPLLKDSDPNVRHATIEALGLIGSKKATLALCDAFLLDPSARGCTADALGKIGDAKALGFLTNLLSAGLQETADDPLTLSALIEALGKIGNLETLEELRRHLGDVEGELRLMLLDSIVRVAERYAEPLLFNKSLCTDLIKGLHSDDENIRLSCAKGLSIFRGASITRPLIQALHGDGALEKFLVGHLITRPETFALCVEALDEPACTNQRQIIQLLGKIAWNCVNMFNLNMEAFVNSALIQRAFEAVRRHWETSDEETRESIVDTLFILDGRQAATAIRELVSDPELCLLPHIIDQLSRTKNVSSSNG